MTLEAQPQVDPGEARIAAIEQSISQLTDAMNGIATMLTAQAQPAEAQPAPAPTEPAKLTVVPDDAPVTVAKPRTVKDEAAGTEPAKSIVKDREAETRFKQVKALAAFTGPVALDDGTTGKINYFGDDGLIRKFDIRRGQASDAIDTLMSGQPFTFTWPEIGDDGEETTGSLTVPPRYPGVDKRRRTR